MLTCVAGAVQPIEHLASFRAMPDILMLRPGDGTETAGAYKVRYPALASNRRSSYRASEPLVTASVSRSLLTVFGAWSRSQSRTQWARTTPRACRGRRCWPCPGRRCPTWRTPPLRASPRGATSSTAARASRTPSCWLLGRFHYALRCFTTPPALRSGSVYAADTASLILPR